uniref:Diels-Alderase poxQ n=1 Tax=Penicillium oxalicum TaxID=69781 RepID=POXQ_PENOX|nr:RecName: Full=Diels-Alderase poxQ; AltName: Full=Oxaleimides biosynthesis cluster protein Q; Flags: Precursor [Penicillium oxalicum]ARF05991.1 PoxQ [Penicillium oxalicum]
MARIPLEFLSITLPVLLLAYCLAIEYEVSLPTIAHTSPASNPEEYLQSIYEQLNLDLPSTCTVNHLSAFDNTPTSLLNFSTSPVEHFDAPKLPSGLNATAGEQWAFDGTSSSGRSGLLLGIYRDASYAFLGPGNFRLSLDLVWDNSTTWSTVDYLSSSTVHTCTDKVVGIWSHSADHYYVFTVTADAKHARIHFHTPDVVGAVDLYSTTPARYPDGALFPSEVSVTQNAPMLHWVEPIPGGLIDVDLKVKDTPFRWTGLGGHERWWSAKGWLDLMTHWEAVRLMAGPYVLSFWQPTSRVNGVAYPSAFLTKYGEKVFSAVSGKVSEVEDYILYRPVRMEKQARETGYEVDLVSPAQGRRWVFGLEYRNQEFEFELGDAAGGRAYVGRAKGGEVHADDKPEEPSEGVFFIEHVDVKALTVPRAYVVVSFEFGPPIHGADIWVAC